jgi:hypothetical protein
MTNEAIKGPTDGETVLHCAHFHAAAKSEGIVHYMKREVPSGNYRFRRPDGSADEARWIVLCPHCYRQAKVDGSPMPMIAGDSVWNHDTSIKPNVRD